MFEKLVVVELAHMMSILFSVCTPIETVETFESRYNPLLAWDGL